MGPGPQLALGVADAYQLQQFQRPLAGLVVTQALVQDQGLGDLFLHQVQRVERGHGLLEDHADAIAAYLHQGLLAGAQQFFTFKANAAARVAGPGVGQQSQHRQCRNRFTRAALAYQRNRLTTVCRERCLAHRLELAR